jgi:hypothetical protein
MFSSWLLWVAFRAERVVSSILRLGPLRSFNLAHLDIDILPHPAWYGF